MCLLYLFLFASLVTGNVSPSPLDQYYYHADVNNRIVEGSVTPEGSAPYMVALRTGVVLRQLVCGASLITDRHVLTAAHCIDSLYGQKGLQKSLRIVVGTNRWYIGGQSFSVLTNITHHNWDPLTVKNDIGILVTKSDIRITKNIKPVALSFDYIGGGVISKVTGWGRKITGGTLSKRLFELIVQTVDEEECLEAINRSLSIEEQNIKHESEIELCAFLTTGKGVCNGDSGSALVQLDTKQQIGIVSWGYGCARGIPDIFVRVSSYKEWIEGTLNKLKIK